MCFNFILFGPFEPSIKPCRLIETVYNLISNISTPQHLCGHKVRSEDDRRQSLNQAIEPLLPANLTADGFRILIYRRIVSLFFRPEMLPSGSERGNDPAVVQSWDPFVR